MEDEQSKNMVWESILLLEIAILACILGLKFIFLMCTEGKHLDECLANEASWFSFYLG
jgi:cytochrome c oxidase subunit IV